MSATNEEVSAAEKRGRRFKRHSIGTITTGTVTPSPYNGDLQAYINGGAHTLAPPAEDCALAIIITNNGSAGAITVSGFNLVTGDAFTTTDTHQFIARIFVGTDSAGNQLSQLDVTAAQ